MILLLLVVLVTGIVLIICHLHATFIYLKWLHIIEIIEVLLAHNEIVDVDTIAIIKVVIVASTWRHLLYLVVG